MALIRSAGQRSVRVPSDLPVRPVTVITDCSFPSRLLRRESQHGSLDTLATPCRHAQYLAVSDLFDRNIENLTISLRRERYL